MLALLLAVACVPHDDADEDEDDGFDGTTDPADDPQPTGTGDDVPIDIDLASNPTNPLSVIATLESAEARTVHLAYGTGDTLDRRTPDITLEPGVPTEVLVLGLYPSQWAIAPVVDGVEGIRWQTATTFPAPLLETETTTVSGTYGPEEAICAAREAERPAYACTDREGRPTLFVALPENAMFVRPLSDGTFVAHPDGGSRFFQFDAAGRPVRDFSFGDLTGPTTYAHDAVDEHELIEIVEGPWTGAWAVITITWEDDIKGAGIMVFDPDTKQILWDWSAHGAPNDGASIDPQLPHDRWGVQEHGDDWLHANALVHSVDDDGDFFWMSLRHQDWIIEIRAPEGTLTGRLGRQGGFTLTDRPDADWFFHQHAHELVRQPDGRIAALVFDNGNARPDDNEVTRVVEYMVDREAQTAEIVFEHVAAWFAVAAGDADRSPDDSSVFLTRSVGQPFIAEIDRNGERKWIQRFEGEGELYRSEWFPSLYETTWFSETGW